MEVVKKTSDFTVVKKRSGRYGVKNKSGKWVSGDDKTKILASEGLIKVSKAAKKAPAPEAEETPSEE